MLASLSVLALVSKTLLFICHSCSSSSRSRHPNDQTESSPGASNLPLPSQATLERILCVPGGFIFHSQTQTVANRTLTYGPTGKGGQIKWQRNCEEPFRLFCCSAGHEDRAGGATAKVFEGEGWSKEQVRSKAIASTNLVCGSVGRWVGWREDKSGSGGVGRRRRREECR